MSETKEEKMDKLLDEMNARPLVVADKSEFEIVEVEQLKNRIHQLEEAVKGLSFALEVYSEMPATEAMKHIMEVVESNEA